MLFTVSLNSIYHFPISILHLYFRHFLNIHNLRTKDYYLHLPIQPKYIYTNFRTATYLPRL